MVFKSPVGVIRKINTLLPSSGHRRYYSVIRSASLLFDFKVVLCLNIVHIYICTVQKSKSYDILCTESKMDDQSSSSGASFPPSVLTASADW